MPNPVLAAVDRVRRAADDDEDDPLLGRFVTARDADAFAALVRRHGPMVLAVCRRVARNDHLAEDAFQAAFLVLARRAADVRPRRAVRAWLYGVAVRCAQEARAVSIRRRSREVPLVDRLGGSLALPDRPDADELRALDEEIARLPDHLRTAVVLCELDGMSRKDVARRLGLAEGTLSSRLAKARKLLAARLARRGVTAALAGAGFAGSVSGALAETAAGLATRPASAAAAEVARRVLGSLFLARVRRLVPALAVGLVLAGLAAAFGQPGRDGPARLPVELPPATGRILVYHKQHLVTIDPDGKNEVVVSRKIEGNPFWLRGARLSPDGKHVAYLTADKEALRVHLREVGGTEVTPELPGQVFSLCWAPDGRLTVQGGTLPGRPPRLATWFVDPKTGAATAAKVPERRFVHEWFPDGKSFLSVEADEEEGRYTNIRLVRVTAADGTTTAVTERGTLYGGGRLSPDGKRLLYPKPLARVPKQVEPLLEPFGYERPIRRSDLFVGDVGKPESGRLFTALPDPANTVIHGDTGYCWSPDGTRVAYYTCTGRSGDERTYRLVIAAADGSGPKTVLTETHGHLGSAVNFLDWR
jgi:RNA polymerase sigma factor (sigma-70 family)